VAGDQVESEEEELARLTDSARLEYFSDAVIAIAITLLVVELKIPDPHRGELLTQLLDQWPGYVAYIASFGYLAVIWLNHHSAFNRIRHVDRGLKWASVGLLFTAATLPFPTAVLSNALQAHDAPDRQAAVGLYALLAALLCLSWVMFWRYLQTHPRLLEPDVDPDFFRDEQVRGWIGVGLYLAGGALGILVHPMVALAVFAVLPPFYAITSDGLRDSPLASKLLKPSRGRLQPVGRRGG
jgi:uncharacterized membrane protein